MQTLRILAASLALGATARAAPQDEVTVGTAKTSIYLGSVAMDIQPLRHTGAKFESTYKASVFPFFFMGEKGAFHIDLPADDLARLEKGETVNFTGEAENTGHEKRKVTGRAVPAGADKGTIKVRVFVTAKIALVFDTTYRFTGK